MNINLEQARLILGALDETIVIFSQEGEYLDILSAGLESESFKGLIGKNIKDIVSSGTANLFLSRINEALVKSEVIVFEYQVAGLLSVDSEKLMPSGVLHKKAKIIPFHNDGSDSFVAWIAYDFTEYRNLESKYQETAVEDPVTGIFNRRFFFKELNSFYQRFQRGGNIYSVIMLNLDHGEKLSDTYGMELTDGMMTNFVSLIKSALRSTDLFANTGDEDFLILLPDTPSNGAFHLAERVRTALENNVFELGGEQFTITASFGCSEVSEDDSSYDNVINRSEIALYQAKHNGGNCVKRLNYENWKK